MSRLLVIIFIIFITSCNDIEFVYKENKNLINPLYEKTNFSTSGNDINFINSYLPMFFGDNKEDIFELSINIEEKKTKRSVESNQAASMIRYDLKFVYTLISKKKNCVTFEKRLPLLLPRSSLLLSFVFFRIAPDIIPIFSVGMIGVGAPPNMSP